MGNMILVPLKVPLNGEYVLAFLFLSVHTFFSLYANRDDAS